MHNVDYFSVSIQKKERMMKMSNKEQIGSQTNLIYGVDDNPTVGKKVLFGLQHIFAAFSGIVVVPLVISGALGFDSAMTVMVFSKSLRRMLRTSNHIERLNREMKRRSKVIGIFPNEESIIRLMGSVLLERNDTAQNSKAIFSRKSYDELLRSDVPVKLVLIAEEQTQLLAA